MKDKFNSVNPGTVFINHADPTTKVGHWYVSWRWNDDQPWNLTDCGTVENFAENHYLEVHTYWKDWMRSHADAASIYKSFDEFLAANPLVEYNTPFLEKVE